MKHRRKKLWKAMLALAMAVTMLPIHSITTFAAQQEEKPVLDDTLEQEMCGDFLIYLKEVYGITPVSKYETMVVREYYGNYEGYEIVQMWRQGIDYTDDMAYVDIGGYTFKFTSGSFPKYFLAYKDNTFLPVKNAYNMGLFDYKSLKSLADVFGAQNDLEVEMCEAFLTYLEKHDNIDYVEREYELADLKVEDYYGEYSGYHIAQMGFVDWMVTADEDSVGIAGYTFTFGSSCYPPYFLAYKDGEMLLVKDVYEKGSLSKEDIFALGVERGDFVYPEDCKQHNTKIVGAKRSSLTSEGYTGDKICEDCYTLVEEGKILPKLTPNPFEDVREEHYYYNSVFWAMNNKIAYGYTEKAFAPDENCTRAQIAAFIWRAMGEKEPAEYVTTFRDLDENAYYYKAVLWAAENGIISGLDAETFAPEAYCTRAEIVTMLWRAKGKQELPKESIYANFEDVQKEDYYYMAVYWARERDITSGVKYDTFAPNQKVTRGETVAFLHRTFKYDTVHLI